MCNAHVTVLLELITCISNCIVVPVGQTTSMCKSDKRWEEGPAWG